MGALLISFITYIPADADWERTARTDQCTTHRVWRNESIPPRCSYITCDGRRLSLANYYRCHIPCCWLFICLQCHSKPAYPQFVEGHDFNLSPDDQVPHRIWSRRGTWRPSGSTRVLHSNVGDGRPLTNHEHKGAIDNCRAHWRVGRDTSW